MADIVNTSPVTPTEDFRTVLVNQVSWPAVFAGIALSLVTHLLLTMVGAGIGLISLDPAQTDAEGVATFSIVAGVWWVVSGIIAAFIGGYTAGRLSGRPKESTAAWHGLATWAGTTLLIFFLLTTAVAGLVGGVLNAAGTLAGAAGQVAGELVDTENPTDIIDRQVAIALGVNDPAALRDAAAAAVRAAVTADEADAVTAREEAAQALATAQNIPIEQARQQVANFEARFDQATARAAEVADDAAAAAGTAGLFAVLALLLGAIAAWFGGRMGKVRPTITPAPVVFRG
jgi:hypothetical protein